MNRLEIALFVVAFAAGCLAGGVPEDANEPVIVNNRSSTLSPITVIPDKSTDAPPTTSPSTTSTTKPNVTTSASTTSSTPTTTKSPTTTTSATPSTPKSSTTAEPHTTTASLPTTAAPRKGNRFDGPSFIGGIILATGLMGIGFVAFKFYKARTERNYHTL